VEIRLPNGDLDLVFPFSDGSVADHANTVRTHLAVSLWIEQGFSIKEIMTFAGHASVQMIMER
jgi:hypothetical protein